MPTLILGSVSFTCEYSNSITVDSDFKPHVIDSSMKGHGDLAPGLKIVLNDGLADKINLGQPMKVEITWAVQMKERVFNKNNNEK